MNAPISSAGTRSGRPPSSSTYHQADDKKRTHLLVAPKQVADGSGVLDGRLLEVVQVGGVVHMPECMRLVVPHAEVGAEARGAGLRSGAFVGWFHGTSPNPSSGPIARARIIYPREHRRDGHPLPASTRLLHTRSSRPFSGSVDRRGCYREPTVF